MKEERQVSFRIQLKDLPSPNWDGGSELWVGIQEGKDVVQQVKLPAESVEFRGVLRVGNEDSEAQPNFLGAFAQGPKGERFLYICWGRPSFGRWTGIRRAKLPLSGLTWSDLESGEVVGVLSCTDAKGGPICATVKAEFFRWE